MSDLTEFLLARVGEDEAVAWLVAAQQGDRPDTNDGYHWHDEYDLLHIAPARVLADCEAKRRIVGLHARIDTSLYGYPGGDQIKATCHACRSTTLDNWPCPTLRLLAQPYADHPDFDERWRL